MDPVRVLVVLQDAAGNIAWTAGYPRAYSLSVDRWGPMQLDLSMWMENPFRAGVPVDVDAAMQPAPRVGGQAPALPPAVRRLPPGSQP